MSYGGAGGMTSFTVFKKAWECDMKRPNLTI